MAFVKSAAPRVAEAKLHPSRFKPAKDQPVRLFEPRFTPDMLPARKLAVEASWANEIPVLLKLALVMMVSERFAPDKLAPLRLLELKSHPLKFLFAKFQPLIGDSEVLKF